MALEPLYEQDFVPCSYGFRPGRSPHQAVEALWQWIMRMGGGTIVDLDIRRFFGRVDHRKVQQVVRQRVRDGVERRLVGKWLKAGVAASWLALGVGPRGADLSPRGLFKLCSVNGLGSDTKRRMRFCAPAQTCAGCTQDAACKPVCGSRKFISFSVEATLADPVALG